MDIINLGPEVYIDTFYYNVTSNLYKSGLVSFDQDISPFFTFSTAFLTIEGDQVLTNLGAH